MKHYWDRFSERLGEALLAACVGSVAMGRHAAYPAVA